MMTMMMNGIPEIIKNWSTFCYLLLECVCATIPVGFSSLALLLVGVWYDLRKYLPCYAHTHFSRSLCKHTHTHTQFVESKCSEHKQEAHNLIIIRLHRHTKDATNSWCLSRTECGKIWNELWLFDPDNPDMTRSTTHTYSITFSSYNIYSTANDFSVSCPNTESIRQSPTINIIFQFIHTARQWEPFIAMAWEKRKRKRIRTISRTLCQLIIDRLQLPQKRFMHKVLCCAGSIFYCTGCLCALCIWNIEHTQLNNMNWARCTIAWKTQFIQCENF